MFRYFWLVAFGFGFSVMADFGFFKFWVAVHGFLALIMDFGCFGIKVVGLRVFSFLDFLFSLDFGFWALSVAVWV